MTEPRNTTSRPYLIVMAVVMVATPTTCIAELIWGADWRLVATTGLVGAAVLVLAALLPGADRPKVSRAKP